MTTKHYLLYIDGEKSYGSRNEYWSNDLYEGRDKS